MPRLRNVFVFVMYKQLSMKRIAIYPLLLLFALCGCKGKTGTSQVENVFKPGEIWPDNNGVHINAHGGGMLQQGDTYYWFGEHKTEGEGGNVAQVGVLVILPRTYIIGKTRESPCLFRTTNRVRS